MEKIIQGVPQFPHTLWNLLASDANEVERKKYVRKAGTKEEWEGRRPCCSTELKAFSNYGSSECQSNRQGNNVRLVAGRANVLFAFPYPLRQHLPSTPPSSSPL